MRYRARFSYVIPHNLFQYISAVTERRRDRYNLRHLEIYNINAAENGMLLSKTLHSKFGRGAVASLKVC